MPDLADRETLPAACNPDAGAEHERRVARRLNAQFEELKDEARELVSFVLGQRGLSKPEDWEKLFGKAKVDYESGRFLLKRLGAERYLDAEQTAVLLQLRSALIRDIEDVTAADRMMADSAIIAYRNLLRVQGWIGSLCLVVDRELFGQAPLNEIHGATVGDQLAQKIEQLEETMIPLLERCQRMMARSIAHLEGRRRRTALASVVVGQAGQVNVVG